MALKCPSSAYQEHFAIGGVIDGGREREWNYRPLRNLVCWLTYANRNVYLEL